MESFVIGFASLLVLGLVRYFVIAGAFFLLFYKLLAKKLASSKLQLRPTGWSTFLKEIWHSALTCIILAMIGAFVLLGPLRPHTLLYSDVGEYPFWWLPVSLLISLVIHDAYFFWMHLAMHHRKIFSLVHLEHHRSTNPSPWTSYSFHVVEALFEGGIVVLLAFTLPLHPSVIVTFTFVSFVINVYGHLGYEIMPRGFRNSVLFQVIATSCFHNLHHRKFGGNYGLYFRFWDRLMKTEHPEYVKEYDRIQQRRFGGN
ncbi:MAG: sterol desaturase family protein [Chitinophagaceae bacterium]|nr:MAG: sterol desaturase family protein [Chitinophagaceae bacterium]